MDDSRDLAGSTVLVKLTSNDGLGFIGAPEEGPFFCKVAAVDQIGIWVENRNFVTTEVRDADGKFIPKEEQKPQRHDVNLLLPWRLIQTVVKFADEDTADITKDVLGSEGKDAGKIGFIS
jgi:hypothetical protein